MSIFYLIFILLAVYYSYRYDGIEEYDSHKQHRLWLMCAYLVCLAGFSYGLGGDKFTYMAEFEKYPDSFFEVENEIWLQFMLKGQMPLWTLLNIFCKTFFGTFYAVQFVQSAAINIAVCYLVSKYTHRYFLFILIYVFTLQYFVFNTEVMREGLALSFALLGMHEYMSGKKWLFFVLLSLGLLFHISAAIAFLFPFVRFKISWKTLVVAFCCAFSIWLLSDLILGKVMVAVLGGMGAMVEKVLFYSLHASTIFGFLRNTISYLIFPFIIMYSTMSMESSEELKRRKEKMMSFMVVLAVLASSFAGFVRVYNYTQIFYLIMFADFVYMLFRIKKHLIVRVATLAGTIFLILCNYFIYYKTTDTYYWQFFYPYTCILDEDDSVYIREVAHGEATAEEQTDKNVREVQ